jgi:charged multivesicular body protein 7
LLSDGFLFGGGDKWDDLKVTWGVNPFSSTNFASMPRTVSAAVAKGWIREKGCLEGLNGDRYILRGDRAVMLIFNAAGFIAGISAGIPKNLPFNFPSSRIQKFFNDEGSFWSITAYFMDPARVCSANLAKFETGDRLVFVSSKQTVNVPLKETDLSATTTSSVWTKGQCFWTMGQHYWSSVNGQVNANMDSLDFVPIFLQYNKGQLNGFGWGFIADLPSERFEHPGVSVLPQFFVDVPKFFSDPTKSSTISTLHIYLDSSPQTNFC